MTNEYQIYGIPFIFQTTNKQLQYEALQAFYINPSDSFRVFLFKEFQTIHKIHTTMGC